MALKLQRIRIVRAFNSFDNFRQSFLHLVLLRKWKRHNIIPHENNKQKLQKQRS